VPWPPYPYILFPPQVTVRFFPRVRLLVPARFPQPCFVLQTSRLLFLTDGSVGLAQFPGSPFFGDAPNSPFYPQFLPPPAPLDSWTAEGGLLFSHLPVSFFFFFWSVQENGFDMATSAFRFLLRFFTVLVPSDFSFQAGSSRFVLTGQVVTQPPPFTFPIFVLDRGFGTRVAWLPGHRLLPTNRLRVTA